MAASPAFTATVSAITDAFGDPTRRRIYLFARDHSPHDAAAHDVANGDDSPSDAPGGNAAAGVTAAMVAAEVGVHANVARHHLDKLAAGGYLEVSTAKAPGSGAGRPSKRYIATGDAGRRELDFPLRSDDLLLSLLGRALDRLPQDEAEAMAESVGQEYGAAMAAGLTGDALAAGQRSMRSAIQAVADALTAHGFAAHAEERNDRLRIINNHCPFGDVAAEHPVICAVDRGMVRGMLAALHAADDDGELGTIITESSLAAGDTFCATTV